MVYEIKNSEKVNRIFGDWQETMIWSCIQNVMGRLYTTNVENPISAMAILGDFTFFAGEPDEELILYKPDWCKQDFMIMVPENEVWADMMERCLGDKAKKVERYAIKKEPGIFDRAALKKVVETLPESYTIKLMDEELFWRCKDIGWCRDWVSQYPEYKDYESHGLGVVILKDGELVSGASSYSGYQGGIEIEIDTKEEYRRRGLAYICGAKLILECLDRDLYPSWDAQNTWSVALAEKLGYHFDHAYTAYEVYEKHSSFI